MEQYTFSSCFAGGLKAAQTIVNHCKHEGNAELFKQPNGIPIVLFEFFAVQIEAFSKDSTEADRQSSAEYILGIHLAVISYASRNMISQDIMRFMLQYFEFKCHNTPMLNKLSAFNHDDMKGLAELIYMIDPEPKVPHNVGLN